MLIVWAAAIAGAALFARIGWLDYRNRHPLLARLTYADCLQPQRTHTDR